MPKYILNTDGTLYNTNTKSKIDPVDSNIIPQPSQTEKNNEKQYHEIKRYTNENLKELNNNNGGTEISDSISEINNIRHNDFINVFADENEEINRNLLNKIQSNHSYGPNNLLDTPQYETDSYKTMYAYNSESSDSNLFAQEFEIRSGYRFVTDTNNVDTVDLISFIGDHIANVGIQIAFIEGLKITNRAIADNATGVNENFHLKLGNYTYTEFDVFTRYVNKVLNYPNDRSSTADRICAYLIGLVEYIAINKTIDYDNIIKNISNNESENKYTIVGGIINAILAPILQMVIETLLDNSNNKRIILLMKKFMQEKYWINNVLYKHKTDSEASKFFDNTNYYNFKFTIERMNIGLKIINKYVKNSNDINNKKSINLNRLYNIRSSFNDDDKFSITYNTKHNWTNKKSFNATEDIKNKVKESSTKLRGLPSALLLHDDLLKSIVINKNTTNIKDNTIGYLSLQHDIKQNFITKSDKEYRIDSSLIKEIENNLEAEYMPFYFHDLRTNELLAFHAFIDNISDAFAPEYSSASGFGRIDDVKAYVKTTRTINLSFTLVATSENDHDMMWYQINKLISMVYPQWSQGVINKNQDSPFTFPFTQVPTASPLIRLRVGDVIKSNYSRTNLSRLHGTENIVNQNINLHDTTSQEFELLPGVYSETSIVGFASENIIINHPTNIELIGEFGAGTNEKYLKVKLIDTQYENKEVYADASKIIIKNKNYAYIPDTTTTATAPGDVKVSKNNTRATLIGAGAGAVAGGVAGGVGVHYLKGNDLSDNIAILAGSAFAGAVVGAAIGSLIGNNTEIEKTKQDINVKKGLSALIEKNNAIIKTFKFQIDDINNPITGAYESGMGRGLAGFITNIDMNYNESTWETSRIGSKAPIFVKITMGFSPIHDIAPGLDHNGMMRAPVYNVGRLNNQLFGDPHDGDGGLGSGLNDALDKYAKILKNEQ